VLVKTIEKVLGRKAVKEEKAKTLHWFCGIKLHNIYDEANNTGDAARTFFGCLCNQNKRKKGGLNRRYGMKDHKTGLIFLYGQCCASHQERETPSGLGKGQDPIGIGKRKRGI
jgi:hypothetical protein